MGATKNMVLGSNGIEHGPLQPLVNIVVVYRCVLANGIVNK